MAWCNGRINGAHWQPIEDIRAGAPCLRCAEEDLADRVESAERAVIEVAGHGLRSWEHSPTCGAYEMSAEGACDCGLGEFRQAYDALLAAREGR